jgi:GNAT superfamily N-acetyltransferase
MSHSVSHPKHSIQMTDQETKESKEISDALSFEIEKKFGYQDREIVNCISKDPSGIVSGGIRATRHWGWMYISQVWVRADCRGQGLFQELMKVLEAKAQKHGCSGLYIDTFEDSVAKLYEQSGFQRFGRIDDFPAGAQARIYLKKVL